MSALGDSWPWLPPRTITWRQSYDAARKAGFNVENANIAAAISEAESQLDWTVLNDTPSTGDYSVGLWQINYYGSLYAGRVAQFGTPEHLVRSGPDGQARAAFALWQASGFSPWSTYNNGDYIIYLQGHIPSGGIPYGVNAYPDHAINPPTEDYSQTITATARTVAGLGFRFHNAGIALRHLMGRYPNG